MNTSKLRLEQPMTAFQGQTVVITGGSSGIGLALARIIVARGGKVVLVGRDPEKLIPAIDSFITFISLFISKLIINL